jgi:uncharacterized protein
VLPALVNETPFYFGGVGHRLFGILHEPDERTARPAFVFCHSFAEEKLWTHRSFVLFARELAAAGFPVLRFDYRGNGDSEGDFSGSSLTTALEDVRCAVQQVREMTGPRGVALLGLRLGATIASLAAEELSGIERLVLWAPIVDGARYMQEMLRSNLTTQLATYKEIRADRESLVAAMNEGRTVSVDGYEMGLTLYAEVSAVRLAADPKRHEGKCLIVEIDRQARPGTELQQLGSRYRRATVTFAKEEPFWKEIATSYQRPAAQLFTTTLEWLR